MKRILISLLTSCVVLSSFAQEDKPDCLEKTFKFFTTIDGFYLTDYCKYSEFSSAEFMVDNGARSIRKEGVYREVWFHKRKITTG